MKSIFDAINENINITNENVLEAIKKVTSLEQEVIALKMMLSVPEKPNVRGDEGAEGVSSEHKSPEL